MGCGAAVGGGGGPDGAGPAGLGGAGAAPVGGVDGGEGSAGGCEMGGPGIEWGGIVGPPGPDGPPADSGKAPCGGGPPLGGTEIREWWCSVFSIFKVFYIFLVGHNLFTYLGLQLMALVAGKAGPLRMLGIPQEQMMVDNHFLLLLLRHMVDNLGAVVAHQDACSRPVSMSHIQDNLDEAEVGVPHIVAEGTKVAYPAELAAENRN
jgi:hypothetical protein